MRFRSPIFVAFSLIVIVFANNLAATESADRDDTRTVSQTDNIAAFNLPGDRQATRSAWIDPVARPQTGVNPRPYGRQPLGSALSSEMGIGVGESVDLTYDDAQYTHGQGRHIGHWWNGEYGGAAEVAVHFGYRSMLDTASSGAFGFSGYNAYDAVAGVWPRTQDVGCDLQTADTVGWGGMPSLDVMPNGRAIMGAMAHLGNGFLGDGSAYIDNMFFYQDSEFGCTYGPGVNTTFIDSLVYRANFIDQSVGNYSRFPQVVGQWDGSNTIVHVLLNESLETPVIGDHFATGQDYFVCVYFRKVGDASSSGSWGDEQIIDTVWMPWISVAAAPYPHSGVAITYTNVSYYGGLLNNPYDRDVYVRESFDRGLTWQLAYTYTNYLTAIADDPNHFAAWIESQALFDTEGDLHVVWGAKPTSADPYFDGFNWQGFDQNVYHWEKNNGQVVPGAGDIVKVATGSFEHLDDLCGDFDTQHCGFGGSNAGYIANINLGQCDDKLYCIWNQIHERAIWNPWRCVTPVPVPGVADDCSYAGDRLAMANWDIFMSVAQLSNSSLWDMPRNVSNTYTPGCGLLGDPLASGPCGSEYKPSVEKYGFDETGLSLTWPAATIVDLTPATEPPYSGASYLNIQYLDDQFPGPSFWGRTNPPASLNSIKWVRLACVEPVFAPQIRITPWQIQWPEWVELGQISDFEITVINEGNDILSITEIGTDDGGEGWLSVSDYPTPGDPIVCPAGVINTFTFDVIVDASAISTTRWLDGEVWIKSDAANNDSVSISIHLLAAAEVEPVVWDTVMSHGNMFDMYFISEGECVALAVSNHGEIGGLGGSLVTSFGHVSSDGSVNLDYVESGLECGVRDADAIYLQSGSPFTILADDASGTNARLTCSYNDASQTQETGWDPVGDKGSITGGVGTSGFSGGGYDSVYTGKFVNRDTTIAMERIFYAPRSDDPYNETINFVICFSKFYPADGLAHDHVTVGNVCDWNVPSEEVNINTSGVSTSGGFVYVQGTDTTGTSCQPNVNRFATEAFGGGYTSAEWMADNCVNDRDFYNGCAALPQTILADTTHYRDGTPLVPFQPNPDVWWEETAAEGLVAEPAAMDQAVWLTYVSDYSLGATDTLYTWTILTTVRNGSLEDLEAQVEYAGTWYIRTLRACECGCCVGRVGDANGIGGDEPTIGDVSALIDAKFITGSCSVLSGCLEEADVNQSAQPCTETCDDITIGDISVLIDYLFITGPELGLGRCGWGK